MYFEHPLYKLCDTVAYIAHEAIGQKRADGLTPYITHPRDVASRVYSLTRNWSHWTDEDRLYTICAALLHDVLEDVRRITTVHLRAVSIPEPVIHIIELVTKEEPDQPATLAFYQKIRTDFRAIALKYCDRMSNLKSTEQDLQIRPDFNYRRWTKYLIKTCRDVLPLFTDQRHYVEPLWAMTELIDNLEFAFAEGMKDTRERLDPRTD
jgi:(p)ppGpp synthase/HD superfamily hydrolase